MTETETAEVIEMRERVAALEARLGMTKVNPPRELTLAERRDLVGKLTRVQKAFDAKRDALHKEQAEAHERAEAARQALTAANVMEARVMADLSSASSEFCEVRDPLVAELRRGAPSVIGKLLVRIDQEVAAAVRASHVEGRPDFTGAEFHEAHTKAYYGSENRVKALGGLRSSVEAWFLLGDDDATMRKNLDRELARIPAVPRPSKPGGLAGFLGGLRASN